MGSNDSEISFSILAIKNIWIFRIKCPSIKYIYIHTHIHICIYIYHSLSTTQRRQNKTGIAALIHVMFEHIVVPQLLPNQVPA